MTTVRVVEVRLFLATLLVLLIEGVFVFTPTFQTFKDNLRSLENSDRRWREYTTTLAQRNKQLEEAHEEAWQARSKTLLPVKMIGNQYLVAGRDHVYHFTRGPPSSGLVCECSATELGYVCMHILSASHFQEAQQRDRPHGVANNGAHEWNPNRSDVHEGTRSSTGPYEWTAFNNVPQGSASRHRRQLFRRCDANRLQTNGWVT